MNFRCLPFSQACRLPIMVSHKTKIKHLNGDISVSGKMKVGLVKIGLETSQLVDFQKQRTLIDLRGKVSFNGRCKIGAGSRVFVSDGGTLIFNDDFCNSAMTSIICYHHIEFGNNNHVSWNTQFMDSDQHAVYNSDGVRINENAAIRFEDNVWCGCNVIVLKGTELAHDTVVGAGSVGCGKHTTPHVVLAGQPAKVVKEGTSWGGILVER